MAIEAGPLHQSFVTYGRYRYAVAALLMGAACAAGYLSQPGNGQPNGGTWLGLTLGTIAAAIRSFAFAHMTSGPQEACRKERLCAIYSLLLSQC